MSRSTKSVASKKPAATEPTIVRAWHGTYAGMTADWVQYTIEDGKLRTTTIGDFSTLYPKAALPVLERPEPVVVKPVTPIVKPVSAPVEPSKPKLSQLVESVRKGQREPTAEQKEILQAVRQGHPVLMIEAGAGTGKTTTLRMMADVLAGNGQYTAFNASLVAESGEKFAGTQVACNTTHSLAFRSVGKAYSHRLGGSRMRGEQVAKILGLTSFEIEVDGKARTLAAGFLAAHVLGAIKRFCQSDCRQVQANHFRYIDGIDMPQDGHRTSDNNKLLREHLLPYADKAWADLCNKDGSLPFHHDHYVKIWQLGKPVIAGDYILLDEAQDTAPVMLDVLKQQTVPVIIVGDSAQQIYEWRGAVNALAAFPNAPRLLLSQSFRFGEAVAKVANAVLDQLFEGTPLRLKGLPAIPSRLTKIENPMAVLCRTNATAVSTLLGALTQGKKAFLVGGGSDVISFVEAAKALQNGGSTSHPELACFENWADVQEYSKQDEGEDLRLMVKLIDQFKVDPIINALKNMPVEAQADLVVSTAHKSKGREWDSVVLASDFPTRDRCSDSDLKLLYVAVTRAKIELDLTGCPFFNGKEGLSTATIAAAQPTADVTAAYKAEQAVKKVEQAKAPPAPAYTKPAVAPTAAPTTSAGKQEFGWAKGRDGNWLVRGPAGMVGKTVKVSRKNGSTSDHTLLSVAKEFEDATLYNV